MTPATTEQKVLEGLTVCRICNQAISVGVPIIGEKPQDRARRFMLALHEHVRLHHLAQSHAMSATAKALAQQFQEMLIVQCYATEDPLLQQAYDAARAPIHALTRKHSMTDEQLGRLLTEKLSANGFMTAQQVKQASMLAMPIAKYIRDVLSEQGEFEHSAVKAAREASQTIVA